MRIAFDLSPVMHRKAGLGRYALTLAENLLGQNSSHEYIAFTHGRFRDDLISPSLRVLPRAVIPLDARPWRMGVWLAHALGVGMERVLPSVDVFHATEHLLPRLTTTKAVFTLHDLIFHFFPEYHLPLNRWFLVKAMPHFLRRADAIIAVSECTKRDAISIYGLPPEKISVIYEGVDPSLKPVSDPYHIARVRALYARNQPFLFFLGTIEPRKNIIALVDTLRILRERGHPHRLLIAGRKGWLYQETLAYFRKTGMDTKIDLLDYVPDEELPAIFAACDAFVFPSLYEGFGLPPLEAMACGAPVIAANTSSLPEVLGEAALWVDPRAPREIAHAVERVISDSALRSELRALGLAQAKKFSWERAARETVRVYERVVRGE